MQLYISWLCFSSWADLVEGVVPQAVASAVQANLGLRSGLPRDYLEYMGVVHSDEVLWRFLMIISWLQSSFSLSEICLHVCVDTSLMAHRPRLNSVCAHEGLTHLFPVYIRLRF